MTEEVVHNDQELQIATDYLEHYLRSVAAGLEIYKTRSEIEVMNAGVDSMLIRARSLLHFLYDTKRWKSHDVLAIDYFHDHVPRPYDPTWDPQVEAELKKVSLWLAHITTDAMPTMISDQDYDEKIIGRAIIQAFQKWLSLVDDSRLQQPPEDSREKFREHLERIKRLVT